MKEEYYMIKEAAAKVGVESHVLRYWEEELKMEIHRNEMGHRYYTEKDIAWIKFIQRFQILLSPDIISLNIIKDEGIAQIFNVLSNCHMIGNNLVFG